MKIFFIFTCLYHLLAILNVNILPDIFMLQEAPFSLG